MKSSALKNDVFGGDQVRAEQEAAYRERVKAAAELAAAEAAAEEAEAEAMKARIAAIMDDESGGGTLSDLMNAASSEEEEDDEADAKNEAAKAEAAAAVTIQARYRGHASRLKMMDANAREVYELRRDLAEVHSAQARLKTDEEAMVAAHIKREQYAEIHELAEVEAQNRSEVMAARKETRRLEKEQRLVMQEIESCLNPHEESEEETEEEKLAAEAKRWGKFGDIFTEASKNVAKSDGSVQQVRRREERVEQGKYFADLSSAGMFY